MSTRSVIAIPTDDGGWRGRYCHSDGYPISVGHDVFRLVSQHGLDEARRVLVEDHYGWSCIDPDETTLYPSERDGRFQLIEGWGVAYTTHEGQSSPDHWVEQATKDCDGQGCAPLYTEWVYVLDPDRGLVIHASKRLSSPPGQRVGDGAYYRHIVVDIVPWDADIAQVDWGGIQQERYG